MRKETTYSVLVGNIGYVESGQSIAEAMKAAYAYRESILAGGTRAEWPVTVMSDTDDAIVLSFDGDGDDCGGDCCGGGDCCDC